MLIIIYDKNKQLNDRQNIISKTITNMQKVINKIMNEQINIDMTNIKMQIFAINNIIANIKM